MPNISLLNIFTSENDESAIVARYKNKLITKAKFIADIQLLLSKLQQHPEQSWALFDQQAYPFAVALFALALAKKDIILPGNDTAHTLKSLDKLCDAFIGDFEKADIDICVTLEKAAKPVSNNMLPSLDLDNTQLTIFTSGSSGEPKAIKKSLRQFEYELQSLEQCFSHCFNTSGSADKAVIIATVSHQHIYGLIFRILWPLAAGRIFISERMLDTALLVRQLIEHKKPMIWIASPAHLKRLQDDLPWNDASNYLNAIFSSGGPLAADSAFHLNTLSGQTAIEVFGSSETGGIAYRQQRPETEPNTWTSLPGVLIKANERHALMIKSAHIDEKNWYISEDAVEIISEQSFILKGRLDRIVKLEEKRLSLVELEKAINNSPLVNESYCLVLPSKKRDSLACLCQLSPAGQTLLKQGKLAVVKTLKTQLKQHFELSLIPKKWRFIDKIPCNSQSKIDKKSIIQLFEET